MTIKYSWYKYDRTFANYPLTKCSWINAYKIGSNDCKQCIFNRGYDSSQCRIKCKCIDKATNGEFKNEIIMEKSDLRTGYHLISKRGDVFVVLLNTNIGNITFGLNYTIRNNNNITIKDLYPLNKWNSDLTCNSSQGIALDIIEILDVSGNSIWTRDEQIIDITVTVNGKTTNLKDISEETLLNIRNKS